MTASYSAAFWKKCFDLLEERPHKCQRCKETQRGPYRIEEGRNNSSEKVKQRPRTVRLVLVDGDPTNLCTANIGMVCDWCYPSPKEAVITPAQARKEAAKTTLDLFNDAAEAGSIKGR